MNLVYAIKSQQKNYIYVGMTNDIKRRLAEHNRGKEQTTKPYLPFKLIYLQEFLTRPEARKRKKELKSGCGKEYLKSLLH